jgi:hypothetical protein
MARGNQRDKAREANQKKMAAQVCRVLKSLVGQFLDATSADVYVQSIEVEQQYVWK